MDTPKKPPIEAINRSPWSAGSWFFSSISTAQTLKLVSPCATHGLGHQEAIGSSFPLCARRGSAPGRTSYKICACPCPWKHPPSMRPSCGPSLELAVPDHSEKTVGITIPPMLARKITKKMPQRQFSHNQHHLTMYVPSNHHALGGARGAEGSR